MAGCATDSFIHMNAVIEIYMIRQTGDLDPLQRHIFRFALDYRLQHRLVREYLRMTGQTGLGGWHTSEGRRLHRRMAIAAIDPQLARMLSMAERHGLTRSEPDLIKMRRLVMSRRHEPGTDN
jgi:hypothetical protein